MTNKIHLWGTSGSHKVLTSGGKIAFKEDCCCGCYDCNCCPGLDTIGCGYTVYAHYCNGTDWPDDTQPLVFGAGEPGVFEGNEFYDGKFTVECIESPNDTPGVVHLRITATAAYSCACVYSWSEEVYLTCIPLDYTFVLHTEEGAQPPSEGCPGPNHCCGDITIRIFSYDCTTIPDVADCQACHFCVNQTLYANIVPDSACDDYIANPTQVTLTFTEDCVWWSELECWDGESGVCCYKLKFEGDRSNNRYCDWHLTVYDAQDNIIVNRLQADSCIADGFETNFPAFNIPCCGNVTITITD